MQVDENMTAREKQLQVIENEVNAEVEKVDLLLSMLLRQNTADEQETWCQMFGDVNRPWLRLSHYEEIGVGDSWRSAICDC